MFKKLAVAGLLTAFTISQSIPAFAGPPGPGGWHGGGPGPGWHGGPGPGWHGGPGRWGGWGPGGQAMFWTSFGLAAGALALGALVTYLPPERTVVYSSGVPYYYYNGTYFVSAPGGYVVANPPTVVVQQPAPIVVQQPAPQVIVQQQAPQQVIVQQPAQQQVVVQQPQPQYQQQQLVQQQQAAPVVQQAPAPQPQTYTEAPAYPPAQYQTPKSNTGTFDVYIPTGNGSFTLIQLTKSGSGYVGPQGEYYPAYPSMDQLKARYVK